MVYFLSLHHVLQKDDSEYIKILWTWKLWYIKCQASAARKEVFWNVDQVQNLYDSVIIEENYTDVMRLIFVIAQKLDNYIFQYKGT